MSRILREPRKDGPGWPYCSSARHAHERVVVILDFVQAQCPAYILGVACHEHCNRVFRTPFHHIACPHIIFLPPLFGFLRLNVKPVGIVAFFVWWNLPILIASQWALMIGCKHFVFAVVTIKRLRVPLILPRLQFLVASNVECWEINSAADKILQHCDSSVDILLLSLPQVLG